MKKAIVAVLCSAALAVPALAIAQPGPNVILGTIHSDSLVGTNHPDVIIARAGNDLLFGLRQDDVLRGGPGNDRLRDWRPHSGTDRLNGGRGFDRCIGNSWDTFVSCEVQRTLDP